MCGNKTENKLALESCVSVIECKDKIYRLLEDEKHVLRTSFHPASPYALFDYNACLEQYIFSENKEIHRKKV